MEYTNGIVMSVTPSVIEAFAVIIFQLFGIYRQSSSVDNLVSNILKIYF
jgi:hypothetical protein